MVCLDIGLFVYMYALQCFSWFLQAGNIDVVVVVFNASVNGRVVLVVV